MKKMIGKTFLLTYALGLMGTILISSAAVYLYGSVRINAYITKERHVVPRKYACLSPDCREAVTRKLNIPRYVTNLATDMSDDYNIDPFLVLAVIRVESEGKWWAISHSGAIGLMQVMPLHHSGPSDDLYNEKLNIYYGIKYLKTCSHLFGRRSHLKSISCYNMGEGNTFHNRINRRYYRDVMRYYYAIKRSADLLI